MTANDTLLGQCSGPTPSTAATVTMLLDGGDGNDTLNDNSGANTLSGGAGDDILNGTGTFERRYRQRHDDGQSFSERGHLRVQPRAMVSDTINDRSYSPPQRLQRYFRRATSSLVVGITTAAVRVSRVGNDVVFSRSPTDQITVKDWFVTSRRAHRAHRLCDGTGVGHQRDPGSGASRRSMPPAAM